MHGDLEPGQRLVENDIAEQMGMSRAPVREALCQLETEGLVVSEPHRGTFVAELSDVDLWEIYTLRAAIESLAVSIVTEKASAETLMQLQQAVDDMAQAAQEDDLPHLATLDMSFHETLCRASGHSRLLTIWLSMTTQIRTFIDLTSILYLPADEVVSLHREVVEHIQNGRDEEAGRAIARHILDMGERIRINRAQVTDGANASDETVTWTKLGL